MLTSTSVPPLAWFPLVVLDESGYEEPFSVAMTGFLHVYGSVVDEDKRTGLAFNWDEILKKGFVIFSH